MRQDARSTWASSTIALLAFALSTASPFALAQSAQDVSKLLKAGQIDQASRTVDAALAAKPSDAQLRFLKGVVLSEQQKKTEAMQIFVQLTEDFPELAEPWNNLAVLYAGDGQYDKARSALELSLKIQPNYATAQENLGDVYVKLAAQAYEKAIAHDANNRITRRKLDLSRDLLTPRDK